MPPPAFLLTTRSQPYLPLDGLVSPAVIGPKVFSNWLLIVLSILSVLLVAVPFIIYWVIYGRLCRRLLWVPFRNHIIEKKRAKMSKQEMDAWEMGLKSIDDNSAQHPFRSSTLDCQLGSVLSSASTALKHNTTKRRNHSLPERKCPQNSTAENRGIGERHRWFMFSKDHNRPHLKPAGLSLADLAERGKLQSKLPSSVQEPTPAAKPYTHNIQGRLHLHPVNTNQQYYSAHSRGTPTCTGEGRNTSAVGLKQLCRASGLPAYWTGLDGPSDLEMACTNPYHSAKERISPQREWSSKVEALRSTSPYLRNLIKRLHRYYVTEKFGSAATDRSDCSNGLGTDRFPGETMSFKTASEGSQLSLTTVDGVLYLPIGITTV